MKKGLGVLLLLASFLLGSTLGLTESFIETDNSGGNGSYTSGNLNSNINLSMVLSDDVEDIRLSYVPSEDENTSFSRFKMLEQQLVADLHGQDPKSFMPEEPGYFRIVDTRGAVYAVASKLLLYIFLAFGVLKVVFGYFTTAPKNYISKTLANERSVMGKKFKSRYLIILVISVLVFFFMFMTCLGMLFLSSTNKTVFYSTGMNLKYLNTEIHKNIKEADTYINQINSAKLTLRSSSNATDQFVVRNNMPRIVEAIANYSKKGNDLNDNILTNTILVGVSFPLFCLIVTVGVFAGSLAAVKNRSTNIINCLYFVCAIMGSFCLLMTNYQISSIFMFTDMCEQMRILMTPGQTILNKGGIKQYLACLENSFQKNVTEQISNVAVGEYILLEQINFELDAIKKKNSNGDSNVTSITDALSRTFQVMDSGVTYFRDNYMKLANLTNIVKKKLLRLPYCYYLSDWCKSFNQEICDKGLNSSYAIHRSTLWLSCTFFLFAVLCFYIDRYVVQVREIDRVESVQLYMRFPVNQHPLYKLNAFDNLS